VGLGGSEGAFEATGGCSFGGEIATCVFDVAFVAGLSFASLFVASGLDRPQPTHTRIVPIVVNRIRFILFAEFERDQIDALKGNVVAGGDAVI